MNICCQDLDLEKYELIDIREEYEREEYAHPKALHIPMAKIIDEAENLSQDVNFVIHCQSGNRSEKIVKMLHAKGHKNFLSLDGGANELQTL